jgi:fatty-acid peroxygenase
VALINTPHSPVLAQQAVPRTHAFDSTLWLHIEGYRFITRRCDAFDSDLFVTRLLLHNVICMRGEEAARMFYQPGRFTRRRVFQPAWLNLLRDYGSVQLLDGEAHRRRKAMLMSLLGSAERQRLVDLATAQWRARFAQWTGLRQVELHREAEAVLCHAACEWAGVPASASEIAQRTAEFSAMIDGAITVGPRHWKGMLMRNRTRRWVGALAEEVRSGHVEPPYACALDVIARHREADGELISGNDAAADLINMLRPIVAVARYIVFGALAMHQFPEWRRRIAGGDDAALTMFVREVVRYYPLFTSVGGRACHDFDWNGLHFETGTWVLLDLYGTDHRPATWGDPDDFRPERFAGWTSNGYDLIPQGGGDYYAGHRCPGDVATIELTKAALRLLATELDYGVPPQDLRISLSRMPTLPASGFVIDSVRRVPDG